MDLHKVSKFIIFLPLILIFGFSLFGSRRSQSTQPTPQPVVSPAKNTVSSSKKTTIDLNGPYICAYNDPEMKAQVYIKQKQVFAALEDTKTHYMLLKQDCIYMWDVGATKGSKICGIGQYVSMYETFGSNFDIGSIIPMFLQMQGANSNLSMLESKAPDFAKSCKKQEVPNEVFVIPSSIQFIQDELKAP